MAILRALDRTDLPHVAQMRRRCFDYHRLADVEAQATYFDDLFFGNPWFDPDLPSLVHAEADGTITGFLGRVPRPLVLDGRALRAAVFTQFMVDPACRGSGAGRRLVEGFFAGPQDLSFTDVANAACRRVWESAGGVTAWANSLQWTRTLRPAALALGSLRRPWLAPAATLADALVRRLPGDGYRPATGTSNVREVPWRDLPDLLARCTPQYALKPAYGEDALAWLERRVTEAEGRAPVLRAVLDASGDCAGWFMYSPPPGDYTEVLQIGARAGAERAVVDALFTDAFRAGASRLRGALAPPLAEALCDAGAVLRRRGSWMLVQAREAALVDAFLRGRAFNSRIDCEWWISC
ncbi:MAG: GNAT family N-acetyltransferase [Gammaproteobacteria bacterium]